MAEVQRIQQRSLYHSLSLRDHWLFMVECPGDVPAPVRPGTPPCFCGLFCMLLPPSSFGSPGTLVAKLLGPWPLMFPWFRLAGARFPPGRSVRRAPPSKARDCRPWRPRVSLTICSITFSGRRSALAATASQAAPPRALCVSRVLLDERRRFSNTRVPNGLPEDSLGCQFT